MPGHHEVDGRNLGRRWNDRAGVVQAEPLTGGVPHVFQGFAAILDEGDAAMASAAAFVTARLSDLAGVA